MGDISLFGEDFRHSLELLRCSSSSSELHVFMSNQEFEKLSTELISSTGDTESTMIIEYFTDIISRMSQ